MPYSATTIPTRGVIKQNAKIATSLQSRTTIRVWLAAYGLAIGVGFAVGLIFSLAFPFGLFLANIFYFQILQCGEMYVGLKLYRKEHIEVRDINHGFRDYARMLGGTLWWLLWTLLWGCIPVMNVIKIYSYGMMPFILLDHPELTVRQALRRSIQMMEGRKFDLFVLELSFIGWQILNLLTFGILGVFYVTPYFWTSIAGFYVEIEAADRSRTYSGGTSTRTGTGTTVRSAEPSSWVCPACRTRNTMDFCTSCGNPKSLAGVSGGELRKDWPEPPRTTSATKTPDPYFKRPKGF